MNESVANGPAERKMIFAAGETLCGFTVESAEELPEIDGTAYTLRHGASGARLLYLRNNDDNKAFSIAFKTPPADDTGVFHILEHSVLCGSEKFPVKEPFVNLLKTSMQTFLNAMTFPDKTMYPVASTNEQDLMNLADVYMDAVLHPAIYAKRTIFEQEGWHYEVEDGLGAGEAEDGLGAGEAEDGLGAGEADGADGGEAAGTSQDAGASASDGRLTFNGVVFNEMKGALSDPDSVLYDTLAAALFPDTAYRFESGGTPEAIAQLTYEGFLDHHARHYNLGNSYITLYGNLDPVRFLGWLDERYLAPDAGLNAQAGQPNELTEQKPVANFGVQRTMVTAPENACMALGYVVGSARDRRRLVAADIVLDAIMGSNEAPLKRALLDAHLADDAQAYLADALLQPFAVVQLKGLQPHAREAFRPLVEETVKNLVEGGLDHALLEASLSRAEFAMRERNFGMADGVALAMASLSGWLYDDGLATSFLRYEDDFAFLREQLEGDYFEQLLRELVLENGHAASAEVIPVEAAERDWEAERLDAAKRELGAEGLARVARDVAKLRAAQEAPDTPEALATLPRMRAADIGPAPEEPAYAAVECPAGMQAARCLRHSIPTHGIAYAYRYFGLQGVSFEELPYVSVLAMVLGKLDTAERSARELDVLMQNKLGNLSFFAEVHEGVQDSRSLAPVFAVSASALSENVEHLVHLVREVLFSTRFDNMQKVRDILVQKRVAMEQGFAAAGHSAAMARTASYYLPAGVLREQMGGVDFYRFLKDMLEHFDEQAPALAEKLADLCKRLFTADNMTVSFTGSDDDFAAFGACEAASPLPSGRAAPVEGEGSFPTDSTVLLQIPEPEAKNEAFAVPSDVTYAALAYDRRLLGVPYSGAWLLASRILSYDYLWNEVRVKGGAYGAGFQVTRASSVRFYSYRDPHLSETLERFSQAGRWLESFEPDEAEMDGYVVSTVASLDAPHKPRELARRQDGWFFAGVSPQSRAQTRREVLEATPQDVRVLAPAVTEAADKRLACVFGNRDIIEQAQEGFAVIDLLGN